MSTASWKVAAAAVFVLSKVVSADPVKGPNGNYYELFPVTGPSMTWQEAKDARRVPAADRRGDHDQPCAPRRSDSVTGVVHRGRQTHLSSACRQA